MDSYYTDLALHIAVGEQSRSVDVLYHAHGTHSRVHKLHGKWNIFKDWLSDGTKPSASCWVIKESIILNSDHKQHRRKTVLAKIQPITYQRRIKDVMCESTYHKMLSNTRICPRFIVSAVVMVDNKHAFHITLMENLENAHMLCHLHARRSRLLDVKVYRSIEQAFCKLWRFGIAHADSHSGNIMVMPDKSIRIIDFGLSIRIPEAIQNDMINALDAANVAHPDKLFDMHYKKYVENKMMHEYNLEHVHFDSLLLQSIRRQGWMRGKLKNKSNKRSVVP